MYPLGHKERKKSAIDRIIWNPELQGSKTKAFKPIFLNHFGQTLHLKHGPLQQKNLKQNKNVYTYIYINICKTLQ